MKTVQHIAKQIRRAFFEDNWCGVSLRKSVEGLSVAQVTQAQPAAHSIAELVFHIGYYYEGVLSVLRGGPLEIRDKFSFDMPPVLTEADWQALLQRTWAIAEEFIERVEGLSDEQLSGTFVEEKYGDYYRNLTGIVEHLYYHLGQIVLLKKSL
ncbi:MAG: DinB family protein [Bacteroidota bacterium]